MHHNSTNILGTLRHHAAAKLIAHMKWDALSAFARCICIDLTFSMAQIYMPTTVKQDEQLGVK